MRICYNIVKEKGKAQKGFDTMRFEDLMKLKNDTERMNTIRERLSKCIYKAMCEEFGEEFCRYIDTEIGITPNASKVAKNTVVVDVGEVKDKDNFSVGAVAEITVKTKKWNDVKTKNGKTTYGVSLDDYDTGLNKHREEDE